MRFASQWPERVWAVEGANGIGRPFALRLVADGERVLDVPAKRAAVAGLIHAAFSLYWALGGRWLLRTVGEWAVDYARDAPVAAGMLLATVAAVKCAAALVPVLVSRGRLPRLHVWRGFARLAAVGLIG